MLPKHAQPQTYQYRGPVTQMHHASPCGYHHKQRSSRVVSNLALGQQYVQRPDAHRKLDSSANQTLWHFYQVRQPEYGCLRSLWLHQHDLVLSARCDLGPQLFYQVRGLYDPMYAGLQTPEGLSLREQGGGQYKVGRCHHQPREQHGHPRFCHRSF